MTLTARIRSTVGSFTLDAALDAADGETVAVLGPNGAGKTTLLRALAGLAPIDAGEIALDHDVLDDGDRRFVPPERRPVGVVFQDYLLFPHLSVLDNVAFGLRSRGTRRAAARARAREALERVGLADRGGARPDALSGGQAQRVALVRALVTEPRLLLLDEPLAALDPTTRTGLRRELADRLAAFGGVRVLVTHDPRDAATLADRIVVVEAGRVVQSGPLAEVVARPRSAYVADLVGVNLLRGTGRGDRVELTTGGAIVATGTHTGDVFVVVHPRSVSLHAERPTGSPRNVVRGTVATVDTVGDRVRVALAGPLPLVAEITPGALADLTIAPGRELWASVKATDVDVFT